MGQIQRLSVKTTFSNLMLFMLCLYYTDAAGGCRVIGEGCASHIPCCSGTWCEPAGSPPWGFGKLTNSQQRQVRPQPAPRQRPAPIPPKESFHPEFTG
ncbi:hypothetical protein BV898_18179 [Hypsibius exemplaris]|uniref:Granulins domain-containing protein n=1 Tax=Hypsibius exemplaris TaxID=2072580 RepID=A0A9X6NGR9_HYPEX|nr:hypothetical protein BV898_18179 [Hypsibius exemplaris]